LADRVTTAQAVNSDTLSISITINRINLLRTLIKTSKIKCCQSQETRVIGMREIEIKIKKSSLTRPINVELMVQLMLLVAKVKFRQKNFRRIINSHAITPRKVTVTSIRSNKKVVFRDNTMYVKRYGMDVELTDKYSKTTNHKKIRANSRPLK